MQKLQLAGYLAMGSMFVMTVMVQLPELFPYLAVAIVAGALFWFLRAIFFPELTLTEIKHLTQMVFNPELVEKRIEERKRKGNGGSNSGGRCGPLTKQQVLDYLNHHIYGQEVAKEIVAEKIEYWSHKRPDLLEKPLVLCFPGPTGVGKTEMAKVIANLCFGESNSSEFPIDCASADNEFQKTLLGSAKHLQGGDETGGLIAHLNRTQGNCVVVLDESDKLPRDSALVKMCLNWFDKGILTPGGDARQNTLSRNSIIILTSNHDPQSVIDILQSTKSKSLLHRKMQALFSEYFAPEWIGRISGFAPFGELGTGAYTFIFNRVVLKESDKFGIEISSVQECIVVDAVESVTQSGYGARGVPTWIEQNLGPVFMQAKRASLEKINVVLDTAGNLIAQPVE